MDQESPLLVIITDDSERNFYHQLANSLGYNFANIVTGSPLDAAGQLAGVNYAPKFIVIDIGGRSYDVLPELDKLAEYCDVTAKVVVTGSINDIAFYRALIDKGIAEYLTKPAELEQFRDVLLRSTATDTDMSEGSTVISFVGAASGDGSSTIATNMAYSIAEMTKKPTVLVDFDYQFGMLAKNLDLPTPYGIKDIFEHPERGIDRQLVSRMAVSYKNLMDVVVAPHALHYPPNVPPELMRELLQALRENYQYIILDMPHVWTHWMAAALTSSDHIVLAAQLWIKSITHGTRLLNTWKQLGIQPNNVSVVINRSGSKFKEAVNSRDFERVLNHRIDFYLPNDIKTVAKSENQGITVMESGKSSLANQFQQFAEILIDRTSNGKKGPAFRGASRVQITAQETRRLR